jgi:hypothetical protein
MTIDRGQIEVLGERGNKTVPVPLYEPVPDYLRYKQDLFII